MKRQTVRVAVPCLTCAHHGLCAIEEQIEDNLILEVVSIGRPVILTLDCSEYDISTSVGPSDGWSPERRAKFEATIRGRRVGAPDR